MGMTITEQILAAHADKPRVEPGEFITARVGVAMGTDLSTAGAIGVFSKIGALRR